MRMIEIEAERPRIFQLRSHREGLNAAKSSFRAASALRGIVTPFCRARRETRAWVGCYHKNALGLLPRAPRDVVLASGVKRPLKKPAGYIRSFPGPKTFFQGSEIRPSKPRPVFPKTCRFQTLSGWLRTTPRLRNEIAVRYAAMESRNSTPDAIDFRSFTWTSTVQTAGIEESCPSGAELPVGARMIRIKWINLLKDADGGRIGFLSMCTIIILPKIPNQASHHMVTLHRNMTCRSLKRLGAAKGLEDGHMTCHEYMLMCYTRPHR